MVPGAELSSHHASGYVRPSLAVPRHPPLPAAHRARPGGGPSVPGALRPVWVPTRGPAVALLRAQPVSHPQPDAQRVEPPAGRRLRGGQVHAVCRPAGRGTDPDRSRLLPCDCKRCV